MLMREVLYVSERKLRSEFLDSHRDKSRNVELGVQVPGVAAKYSSSTPGPSDSADSVALAAKLERVITFLDRVQRPVDFTSPGLQTNQWITFDLPMTYGTAHEDSAGPGVVDDVALFGGSAPSGDDEDRRPVDLLLCGSVDHLRRGIASHGRLGSDTSWLYALCTELDKRDRRGISVIPEFLMGLVSPRERKNDMGRVAHDVFGSLMRSEHPRPDRGRLRGRARVLLHVDDPRWVTRLVLATPLYVETSPLNPRGWWRRLFGR